MYVPRLIRLTRTRYYVFGMDCVPHSGSIRPPPPGNFTGRSHLTSFCTSTNAPNVISWDTQILGFLGLLPAPTGRPLSVNYIQSNKLCIGKSSYIVHIWHGFLANTNTCTSKAKAHPMIDSPAGLPRTRTHKDTIHAHRTCTTRPQEDTPSTPLAGTARAPLFSNIVHYIQFCGWLCSLSLSEWTLSPRPCCAAFIVFNPRKVSKE